MQWYSRCSLIGNKNPPNNSVKTILGGFFYFILYHVAYITGSTMSVRTVATSKPPLKAIASGLQNTDPIRGIMPKIAAIAVSMIGRKRSVAELIIASSGFCPSALWISI